MQLLFLLVTMFVIPAESLADNDTELQLIDAKEYASLSKRSEKLIENLDTGQKHSAWLDRIAFAGVLEAEAGYERMDFDDPELKDTDASDAVLATMALEVGGNLNENVSGYALFLWEEGNTEPIDLDEGHITISSGDANPIYAAFGKQYVPFGNYETIMISDPLTLELLEARGSALVLG